MRIKMKLELAGLLVAVAVVAGLYGLFKMIPGEGPARPTGPAGEVRLVLDSRSLKEAHIDATYSNGEFDLGYTLTPAGQEWLLETTSTSIGKLLMIEIDGTVVAQPVIKDVMGAEKGLLGMFPEHRELAEKLVRSLPAAEAVPPAKAAQ